MEEVSIVAILAKKKKSLNIKMQVFKIAISASEFFYTVSIIFIFSVFVKNYI